MQYEGLAAANVQVNHRKVDRLGYGLRLRTSHSAGAGVDVPQMAKLADMVALAIARTEPLSLLRERVSALAADGQADAILPMEYWR
jgi:hypothetical protein